MQTKSNYSKALLQLSKLKQIFFPHARLSLMSSKLEKIL